MSYSDSVTDRAGALSAQLEMDLSLIQNRLDEKMREYRKLLDKKKSQRVHRIELDPQKLKGHIVHRELDQKLKGHIVHRELDQKLKSQIVHKKRVDQKVKSRIEIK